jgi:hypothetical protein
MEPLATVARVAVDWSAMLPLLPVAAAILGALVGTTATSFFTRRLEKRKVEQERKGLLYLVHVETNFNDVTLQMFINDEIDLRFLSDYSYPRTETWNNCSVRLAQLIEPHEVQELIGYYTFVSVAVDTVRSTERSDDQKSLLIKNAAANVQARSPSVRRCLKRYLGELPEYSAHALDTVGDLDN